MNRFPRQAFFDPIEPPIRRTGVLVLLAAASLFVVACDTVSAPEPIELQPKTVSFRFEFDSDGVSPGEETQALSQASVDLGPELLSDGFNKGEVLAATVSSVELERVNPTTVNLDFLDEATLAFTASNVSTQTIAQSSSLPNSRTGSLSIGNQTVTAFVVAPEFRATLTVVPGTLPDAGWVLRANVTLQIEVEGV